MKKILVAIPNYNNENYIIEAIDSVLKQSCSFVDIIVFDNASTDDSIRVIENFFTGNSRVLLKVNDSNVGAVMNHNRCIEYAINGGYDYLKILSSDDVLLPNIIQEQFDLLESEPRGSFATCNMIVTDDKLTKVKEHAYLGSDVDGNSVIKKCASQSANYIGAPSNGLLRVSCIGDIRFSHEYEWLSDLKFYCDLLANRPFINTGTNGLFYRRHDNTDSGRISKIKNLKKRESIRFSEEYGGNFLAKIKIHLRDIKSRLL
ncbi:MULTISPECIES: glycosyltransferase family 2 protein [Pectobacterium]|uniref:Glycosyltransferase family 2 protein n=1 Tax=Pectobacterium aquaticum TaxID=2204145 RepID=A0AA93ANI7_9GAMM|nr:MULTISPECIES: glycosyltransferase family A protein [Pectobacterium]MBE5202628.1 glycosyltransferase family 2 protein [Pectobacterium quasiaquaticum]MBE5211088.1 glycosyltransferase family 2 protein [Pectobacterium quasiaquaticum]MBE5222866.1 glycosyltransferase family 2 protein [Pectobacterium quasiaquaticum]RRO22749.1 glycosyltransferase family 2 protein [Pectobacterium aquaticum]